MIILVTLREYWTTSENNLDGKINWEKKDGKYWILIGFKSVHNNHYDDRKYKFFWARNNHLKVDETTVGKWVRANNYDRKMNVQLLENQAIVAVKSHHDNHYEDRVWSYKIAEA